MRALSRFGITFSVPTGWEAALYQRPAAPGEQTFPVLHAASFPLPVDRGDYGSNAVEFMRAGDVFLALLEDEPASARSAMFAGSGLPALLRAEQFSPASLQRLQPRQVGMQSFFAHAGRAFCLYVVLGSATLQGLAIPRVNAALASLRIDPR